MTLPLTPSGLPGAAVTIPPSWVRPAAEKTAPAAETQRDRDRQPPTRETVYRARETTDILSLSRDAQRVIESRQNEGQSTAGTLSAEDQEALRALKARDAEVRRHEQAHQTVGGHLAGAASYETVRGPDGQSYAVGGEVPIDASAEQDPEATIAKMERVKAAALAPAEPSGQDRAVAAMADARKAAASAELRRQDHENAAPASAPGLFGTAAKAYGDVQAYSLPPSMDGRINQVA
jgi:hypothetical protein